MDNEQEAKNISAEPNSAAEPPAVEENTSEVKEEAKPQEPITPEAEAEAKTEEEPKKVSGAAKRIQGLVAKAKQLETVNKSLAEQVAELTGGYNPPPVESAPQSELQPDREVSVDDYKRDVIKTADALVAIRLNQQRVIDNINKEAAELVKSYPELDPDNKETFDKELSDSIAEATLSYVKSNPSGSVKKFVDKLMKPYKNAVEKRVSQDTEKVAKQVTEAALRPTTVRGKEKTFDELTVKEMEEKLGVVY